MSIKIEKPVIRGDGHTVSNKLDIPFELQRYFSYNMFNATYQETISGVPDSILNIPVLSSIIHFAWVIGYDVEIGDIDEVYAEGVEKAHQFLTENPPIPDFINECNLETETVRNSFGDKDKKALLWSGGCDSTASLIKHRDEKPQLITIRGIDMPLRWERFWGKILDHYKDMNLFTIISNTDEIYDGDERNTLGRHLPEGYIPTYSFSVNRLGLCAPVTYIRDIGELMLSSTYPTREYGDPSYPWSNKRTGWIIDETLSWGDVKVHDVEQGYSTTEKIRDIIRPDFEENGHRLIRSCGNVEHLEPVMHKQFNCGVCDKCQRVIASLAVNGLDPSLCGFPSTPRVYDKIKQDIINKRWDPRYLEYHFKEVQEFIPPVITEDFNGSRRFLEWLRGYRFE